MAGSGPPLLLLQRRAREGPPVVWVRAESGREWRRGSINTWNCNMEEKGEILLVAYVGLHTVTLWTS